MGEGAPIESVADRLKKVLDGRSPWIWGKRVQLNDGAIGRLLKNSLPDPERLIPAMHIENLSLNWLLDGMGSPYLHWSPLSDAEAAEAITRHLYADDNAEILIAHCSEGFTPVLHTTREAEVPKGGAYSYRAVTIVSGGVFGPCTLKALASASIKREGSKGPSVRSLDIPEAGWRLLAHGYLGNYPLFGDETKEGLYAQSKPEVGAADLANYIVPSKTRLGQVSEPAATWLSSQQRELHYMFDGLSEADQVAALRMIRGLRYPVE